MFALLVLHVSIIFSEQYILFERLLISCLEFSVTIIRKISTH